MSEPQTPSLSIDDDTDDLPRTLRREKEARAKEQREREAREEREAARRPRIFSRGGIGAAADAPPAATVTRLDVPIGHLAMFFVKAVIAAIPALVLLGVVLLLLGLVFRTLFGVTLVSISFP